MISVRNTLFLFVALAMVLAACSRSSAEPSTTTLGTTTTESTTTTTTTSTTTTTTTTTTTLAPTAVAPTINGLEADPQLMDRRVVAVKIDNHPQARPHSDLQFADAVYEVLVEGGLTRFIALFHQSDSIYVGPVRSGRPTDVGIVKPLGGPFQISGAQAWVRKFFAEEDLPMVYDNGVTTFRAKSRRAPHNLYASTEAIREYADGRGWPDEPPAPLFGFSADLPIPTESATKISLPFSQHPASNWEWDDAVYLHSYGTAPHMTQNREGEVQQVAADVVVVVEAGRYTAWDPAGKGKELPSLRTVGSWPAHAFYDGGVVHATWVQESVEDPARLFDADGNEVSIPPGRLWIEVFPDNQTVTWE